jgi:hypothetical protein
MPAAEPGLNARSRLHDPRRLSAPRRQVCVSKIVKNTIARRNALRAACRLEFGGYVSLIVFLTLYFLFLWVAWVVAVWLTKPKLDEPQGARSV